MLRTHVSLTLAEITDGRLGCFPNNDCCVRDLAVQTFACIYRKANPSLYAEFHSTFAMDFQASSECFRRQFKKNSKTNVFINANLYFPSYSIIESY